jgi:hypothetical protein
MLVDRRERLGVVFSIETDIPKQVRERQFGCYGMTIQRSISYAPESPLNEGKGS